MDKHLPDDWMSPIVRCHLRKDFDAEIIVASVKHLGYCHKLIEWDTDKVRSELLEGCFESSFIIISLTHGIAEYTVSISNEKKHSSGIDSVQSCHIGH